MVFAVSGLSQPTCRSTEYRKEQFKANPSLVQAIAAIENFTANQIKSRPVIVTGGSSGANDLSNNTSVPLTTIPVVVHIVYHTAAENISDAQVQSQIDVLNTDYQKRNADTAGIPSYLPVAGRQLRVSVWTGATGYQRSRRRRVSFAEIPI